jgi:Flp pilus assembly protein TadG
VTTVEFALVLPIFIFLIGIATYFAWMFYVQSQVDRAADRAARYAAVPSYSTSTQNVTDSTTGQTYAKSVTSADYAFCVSKVVDKLNGDLVTGSVAAGDVVVSDGSGVLTAAATCAKPNGYVKVQLSKNFTNPFSYLIAPFTGSTSDLTVTGTGRARVEAQ